MKSQAYLLLNRDNVPVLPGHSLYCNAFQRFACSLSRFEELSRTDAQMSNNLRWPGGTLVTGKYSTSRRKDGYGFGLGRKNESPDGIANSMNYFVHEEDLLRRYENLEQAEADGWVFVRTQDTGRRVWGVAERTYDKGAWAMDITQPMIFVFGKPEANDGQ